jgi:hypothetical protein
MESTRCRHTSCCCCQLRALLHTDIGCVLAATTFPVLWVQLPYAFPQLYKYDCPKQL